MAQRSLKGDVKVEFTEATSRQGIDSGESVKTLFGKIRKWLSDLKVVAFSGSYKDLINTPTLGSASSKNVPSTGNASTSEVVMGNDSRLSDSRPASDVSDWAKAATKPTYTASEVGLNNVGNFKAVSTVASQGLTDTEKTNARTNIGAGTSSFDGDYGSLDNKPTIPPAVAVKGNAETAYRTGNVNLTPANIGAATSAQGTKADSAVQTIKIGGTTQTKTDGVVNLPAYPTKSLLGLDNVNNTSDLDKPISTAAQAALDSQQEQINYNANNGVKNLISTKWFINDNNSTIESRNDKTGSLTSSAPASASATYIQTYIPEDIVNPILENGKTYILSWNVDSRTNNGIFGIRKATGVYHSSSTLNRTGSYSVSYTHDSSVPVFISLCINTSATSAVKRIALSNIMLREATVEDSTFQPYAKSNAELTRYTDYAEISQDEANHTDIISIGATKQLDIVHNDYYLENEIILKGPNVYLPGSAEIVTAGKRAEISLATGAAEVKLVANTDSSNTPYLYLQSGVIPYISIQPNLNKMQFITDANGTQKIAIDTNGVHIVSGGTVFEVKSDGVYINGTKIGG